MTNPQRRAACPVATRPVALRVAALFVMQALLPLAGQSAANFKVKTPQPVPATTQPQTPAVPAAKGEAIPAEISPSRFVDDANRPAYVKTLTAALSIRTRTTDPFGQLQDPSAKPIIKPTVAKSPRYVPMQATPFAEIVRLIKVSTIKPAERKFFIGTRSFKLGDRIPLSFRGKPINAEVTAVSSNAIEFRNVENGETAAVKLSLLPSGMTPGNDRITTPGMVPEQSNTPIDLDGNSLSTESAINR